MPYINPIDISGFLLFVCIIIVDIITLLSGHTDDTDCRISDIVDLRFLDLNAFSELFNAFDSINSH